MKEHLIVKHKWNKVDASSARINFQLNVRRHILPTDLRKSKVIHRDIRYKCLYAFCARAVLRPGNHLRQCHKLSGVMLKERKVEMLSSIVAAYPSVTEPSLVDENETSESVVESPQVYDVNDMNVNQQR